MNTIEEFRILKKLAVIHDLDYEYEIDEDGNGKAFIEGYAVYFEVDPYGEINLWTATMEKL